MTHRTLHAPAKKAAKQPGSYCYKSWRYSVLCAAVPEKKNARSRNYGPFKTKNKKHEAKLIKNIIIDTLATHAAAVYVQWRAMPHGSVQTLKINRLAFQQWLYETCRLDWCLHELNSHQLANNKVISGSEGWYYDKYGITPQDVATYITAHQLASIPCG